MAEPMNDVRGRQLLTATFLATIAVVAWTEVHKYGQAPRPSRFISAGVVYGILGIGSVILTPAFTGLLGLGVFLTLLYAYYNPLSPVASALGQAPPSTQGESGFGGLGEAGGGGGGGGGGSF